MSDGTPTPDGGPHSETVIQVYEYLSGILADADEVSIEFFTDSDRENIREVFGL